MAERRIHPAFVACSPARRTRETCHAVAYSLDKLYQTCTEALYAATATTLLQFLRSVPDSVASVLLVGHNPGLQELAMKLAAPESCRDSLRRLRCQYSAAALAGFTVPLQTWTALNWQGCPLDFFVKPADLT